MTELEKELTIKVKRLEDDCKAYNFTQHELQEKNKELEAQIENIRYYLDNEIPHDLINEATTKIWRMLK